MTPIQRSLHKLRVESWLVVVVERWNPGAQLARLVYLLLIVSILNAEWVSGLLHAALRIPAPVNQQANSFVESQGICVAEIGGVFAGIIGFELLGL